MGLGKELNLESVTYETESEENSIFEEIALSLPLSQWYLDWSIQRADR